MKVLIGTAEIAGWMEHFKVGFQSLGHEVTTAVFEKSPFFNYEYDYELNKLFLNKLDSRQIKKTEYFKRFTRKIRNGVVNLKYKRFIEKLVDDHDLLFVLWNPFMGSSYELEYARQRNKKIIAVFVGSEARYFRAFKQQFNISQWVFPDFWDHADPGFHVTLIRKVEKYANLIYSLPDQAGLQLKPYYHIQVPIASANFKFYIPQNRKLKVLHAPSVPFKKGTDLIEQTLEQLKNEGIDFDFISVRDLPNTEVLKLLSEADVLVDEIVYHGPGSLSFEAMLSGCAVATRYLEDSPACFRPPVWSINADNIYERLKILLSDHSLVKSLAEQGREYVIKNNESKIIVQRMLNDLESNRQFDYFPHFLRDAYIPGSDKEAGIINQWTNYVRDCDWYKEYIEPGEREGLIF